MKWLVVSSILVCLLLQAGCVTTEADKSAAIGTGIGAGLGAILGHNLGDGSGSDRALGAAAGALAGGVLGHQKGRQQEIQSQMNQMQQRQFITTIWVENSNGSKTPVQLRQTDGGQYIGPRGEYYDTMPTQEQLKKIYGM